MSEMYPDVPEHIKKCDHIAMVTDEMEEVKYCAGNHPRIYRTIEYTYWVTLVCDDCGAVFTGQVSLE